MVTVPAMCDSKWISFESHCYQDQIHDSLPTAEGICHNEYHAHLAVPENDAERQLLFSLVYVSSIFCFRA